MASHRCLVAFAALVALPAAFPSMARAYEPVSMTDGDVVLFHSGTSQGPLPLFDAVLRLCRPGAPPTCRIDFGTGDPDDCLDLGNLFTGSRFTVACEIDGTTVPGLTGIQRLLFHNAGELDPRPVAAAGTAAEVQVAFMDATPGGPACIGGSAFEACGFSASAAWLAVPDVGSWWMEPAVMSAPLNTAISADYDLDGTAEPLPPANLTALDWRATGDLAWGVVVNDAFYQVLQAAQFPPTSACHPAHPQYGSIAVITANANSEACMPSLDREAVASLTVSGRTVSLLSEILAPGSGTPLSALIPPGVTLTDNVVQICRRTAGSVAQAQHNLFYFNYPCDRDAADGIVDTPVPAISNLFSRIGDVVETPGVNDAARCLLAYQTGQPQGLTDPQGRRRAAMGLMRTTVETTFSRQYKFVRIDGAAPTRENVHAGHYSQFFTSTLFAKPGRLGAAAQLVFEKLAVALNDPLALGASLAFPDQTPLVEDHGWGRAGWLATPGGAAPVLPDLSFDPVRPVNRWRRVNNARRPSSCAPPTLAPGSELAL